MRHLVCSTVLVQLTIAAVYVVSMDCDQCTIANHQKDWRRLLEGTTSPYQHLFAIFPACLAKLVLITMKAKAGCKFRNVRKGGHTANGKQIETHQMVWTFQLRTEGTAFDTWPNTWPELSGTNLPNLTGACPPPKKKVSRSAIWKRMWKSKSTGSRHQYQSNAKTIRSKVCSLLMSVGLQQTGRNPWNQLRQQFSTSLLSKFLPRDSKELLLNSILKWCKFQSLMTGAASQSSPSSCCNTCKLYIKSLSNIQSIS